MKIIICLILSVFLVRCSEHKRSSQSFTSETYIKKCNKICQEDYGTDVDWVGELSGRCYCK